MMEPVYLDHNASTPMDPRVIEVMTAAMATHIANPSSSEHGAGAAASTAVEDARAVVAAAIGARPPEIVFCSGSTEANNIALLGAFPKLNADGRSHVITTIVEHPSVLEPIAYLERVHGAKVTRLSVDESGRVKTKDLETAITEETGIVSVMAANNETGVTQPVRNIGALCAERGVLFHTDYSQATAFCPLNVARDNVHLASFSGHKMYGPKGIGILYRRLRKPHVTLVPIIHGGGQEKGLRSGTLNTPAIIGLAAAFEQMQSQRKNDSERLSKLRHILIQKLTELDGVQINGDQDNVLPNTVSVTVQGVDPLALMRLLRSSVTFSASSACSTESVETSPVLKAMFGETPRARGAFRLGLGRFTTEDEITSAADTLSAGITQLRSGQFGVAAPASSRQRLA